MAKKKENTKSPTITVTKTADQETTEIICILDRSTSIRTSGLVGKTIEGYNAFIADQKKQPGKAKFTMCLFDGGRGIPKDSKYEIVHSGVDINSVPDLNESTFVPKGMTALYDAIGITLDNVSERLSKTPKVDQPDKVVVLIMTDGEENSSEEYTRELVLEKIKKHKDADKWGFIFIGANIDAFQAGSGIGVSRGATLSYSNDAGGVGTAYANMSKSVTRLRSSSRSLMDDVQFSATLDNLIDDNDNEKK